MRSATWTPSTPPPPRLCQREDVFHVLEDASVVTELLGCGMPFALVGAPLSLVPLVAAGDGRGRLRHVRWNGGAEEQDFHAMAARRTRVLQAAVNPYWESGAFRRAAGREMALARGAGHLSAMLRDMAAAGHRKAFLKAAAQKRGTWVVDLSGVTDALGGALAAHAAMGEAYGPLHEGVADGRADVLVQEFSPFSHEHRFLVVDHRIVASTPSDRALSVLDAVPGRILNPAAARLLRPAGEPGAYDRGASETVEAPALVAAMARSARALVRDLRAEGLLPGCYCLDMGLAGREVLPIEINTLVYCGLYAADWSRVARALAGKPRPESAAPSAGARGQRTDALEDAVEFLLDMLSEEPPRRLREVAERLLAEGERAEEAVRKGREARERREAAESAPPAPEDLGAIAGMTRGLDEAAR